MQGRVRGPIAVVVVWVLLGALAAGAALAVNINGTRGEDMAGGGRGVVSIEEMAIYTRPHGTTEVAGVIEEMASMIKPQGTPEVAGIIEDGKWQPF